MYLIGIKNGISGVGNGYTTRTTYKSIVKLRALALNIKKQYNMEEIYILNNYTQELCELSNVDFVKYIKNNCKKII